MKLRTAGDVSPNLGQGAVVRGSSTGVNEVVRAGGQSLSTLRPVEQSAAMSWGCQCFICRRDPGKLSIGLRVLSQTLFRLVKYAMLRTATRQGRVACCGKAGGVACQLRLPCQRL